MTHQEFIDVLANEFELAFLTTGLTPVRREWGNGAQNGCMVTALDVSEHGRNQPASPLQHLSFFHERRQRVADYLAAKFPQHGRDWWHVFVRYCIGSFDQSVTNPVQWLRRNAALSYRHASAKLMGAAVAAVVARHVFTPAQKEAAPERTPRRRKAPQKVEQVNAREYAAV